MTAGEIIALIVAAGGVMTGVGSLIVSALTARSAARKDELTALNATIATLQAENTRLVTRVDALLARVESLQADIDERDNQIRVLQNSLREQTQARADREQQIQEMKREMVLLQAKVKKLENGK